MPDTKPEMGVEQCEMVAKAFRDVQDRVEKTLARFERTSFRRDQWEYSGGGGGESWVLENGQVIEKGGVNFSDVRGRELPASATANRPQWKGLPFRATGVSVVVHPLNPHAPTSHMNIRFFSILEGKSVKAWWFGGGFDLTPIYGFEDDARFWHQAAKSLCDRYRAGLYEKFKETCDKYFYLPHRQEARGIGGIFFDDFAALGFEDCFRFAQEVAATYAKTYAEILNRRISLPYGERERSFQAYRRGRYAEFNLAYDRGTRFGLESGGRTESILMSLPPTAAWRYDWDPEAGSPEARLRWDFLSPRKWISDPS